MSSSACFDLGRMQHLNGAGWLKHLDFSYLMHIGPDSLPGDSLCEDRIWDNISALVVLESFDVKCS